MKKNYLIFCLFFLFIASCQQPEDVDSSSESAKVEEVKPEVALKIAKNFNAYVTALTNQKTGGKNTRTAQKEKTVKKSLSLRMRKVIRPSMSLHIMKVGLLLFPLKGR